MPIRDLIPNMPPGSWTYQMMSSYLYNLVTMSGSREIGSGSGSREIGSGSGSHRTPVSRRPREPSFPIYLSQQPGGVWWEHEDIVYLLGKSFTSTYSTYVTNWSDCRPEQRDAMFNYFRQHVRTEEGYDLRRAYEERIKRRITYMVSRVASSEKRPIWMPPSAFEDLMKRKEDPKFVEKAQKAKANRLTGAVDGKAPATHVLGRQSSARVFNKMGPTATPHQLLAKSKKKKDGGWLNQKAEGIDAEYQRKKAQLDAGEITQDEYQLYLEAAGGFDRKQRVFGLGGVARELFTPQPTKLLKHSRHTCLA